MSHFNRNRNATVAISTRFYLRFSLLLFTILPLFVLNTNTTKSKSLLQGNVHGRKYTFCNIFLTYINDNIAIKLRRRKEKKIQMQHKLCYNQFTKKVKSESYFQISIRQQLFYEGINLKYLFYFILFRYLVSLETKKYYSQTCVWITNLLFYLAIILFSFRKYYKLLVNT